MLQYSVHPPPLSVSFGKKTPSSTLKFRSNDRRPSNPSGPAAARPITPQQQQQQFQPLGGRMAPLPPHLALPDEYDDLPSPSFPPASLPRPISRPTLASSSHPHHSSSPTSYFPSRTPSSSSSAQADIPDVLRTGDIVGPDVPLRNEPLRVAKLPAPPAERPRAADQPPPDAEFEVVRKLGTGSYAVVYLVREVLERPPLSDDGHVYASGKLDWDDGTRPPPARYGREYAVKLLSKANLDADQLAAQLFEATIHQSLPSHPNLVSLHRTYETSSYLLLLLEFVPGEDLFYFLEQSRDHYSPSPPPSPSDGTGPARDSRTPPTPGLLSSMHPSQLLSPVRLRLIASMFSQMCDAVAVCHDHGVFHRDIKPENFIVTDGLSPPDEQGRRERRVVVKLSDFGLSTTDIESSDMDCGSAPYMAYECRNNLAPTYRPRAADVWSLGIVLINMLYHCNPWTDTADGVCPSFTSYRATPVPFLLARFPGMTPNVASFLANRVFCILPDPGAEAPRATAREFGAWIRDLPAHFGAAAGRTVSGRGHSRAGSISSLIGHTLGSVPPSRRPSSRVGSLGGIRLSRAPSVVPPGEDRAPVINEEAEAEVEEIMEEPHEINPDAELDGPESRTSTSTKRRKRGARKGKGQQQQTALHAAAGLAHVGTSSMDTSEILASASQSLARELSKASKGTGKASVHSLSPSASFSALGAAASVAPPLPPIPATVAERVPAKKPSIWKLGFGSSKTSESRDTKEKERESPRERESPVLPRGSRAANVSDIILGLDAPAPPRVQPQTNSGGSIRSDHSDRSGARGRQPREQAGSTAFGGPFGSGAGSAFGSRSSLAVNNQHERELEHDQDGWRSPARSPARSTTRSAHRSPTRGSSGANSWRNSMASTNTSSSAFTRYSNQSVRSVSTYATSVSSAGSEGNWRAKSSMSVVSNASGQSAAQPKDKGKARKAQYPYPYAGGIPPPNVKIMTGVPWELAELPRQLHPKPHGDIFGQPPAPRPRRSKQKPPAAGASEGLGTISESRVDAGTSTTDLALEEDGAEGPKKVQRGQINALAKMLGALRR